MATQLATLAQVKAYIGNSADGTDDALLMRLVDHASSMIERACNRVFGQATYTETRNGNGRNFLVLNNRPVTAITALSIDGKAIAQSTGIHVAGWVLSEPWKVALRNLEFTAGIANVEITYTAGYDAIPNDINQACCLVASLAYKERDRMGIDSKSVGGETITFTNDEPPPSVRQLIENYRNVYQA